MKWKMSFCSTYRARILDIIKRGWGNFVLKMLVIVADSWIQSRILEEDFNLSHLDLQENMESHQLSGECSLMLLESNYTIRILVLCLHSIYMIKLLVCPSVSHLVDNEISNDQKYMFMKKSIKLSQFWQFWRFDYG